MDCYCFFIKELNRDIPRLYFEILQSHIDDRYFQVRHGFEYLELWKFNVLVIFTYYYKRYSVRPLYTLMATFADDPADQMIEKTLQKDKRGTKHQM